MERRRHTRVTTRFPARLCVLRVGEPRAEGLGVQAKDLHVRVDEISGAGVRLWSAERVPVSMPVRLEWEDAMFLGECVHVRPSTTGGYIVGIHLEQAISGLQDLRNLMVRLTAEAEAAGNDAGTHEWVKKSTASRSRKFPTQG